MTHAWSWPPTFDDATRFVLHNASVPSCLLDLAGESFPVVDGLVRVDIALADGRIDRIAAPGALTAMRRIDLDGGQVWPCFVDLHTHLDKGHIWPRTQNPDGTFPGALASAGADRSRYWSAHDVRTRMDFGLRCAFAHGTAAIRTHLDSISPQHRITWPVFAELREEWRGRIELQAVSILLIEHLRGDFGRELADLVATHGGILGAVVPQTPSLRDDLDRAFALAAERGLDLDLHADESNDPDAAALRAIAEATLKHRFGGRVVVGHCCSLSLQEEGEVDRTLDLVAKAGITVVSLPMCNMFLQDRVPGRTPRWRGVTLVQEMRARGIPVALASDNCRDPFHAYGDHDMLEVFREGVRIAQLDRPVGEWPMVVTRTPARAMNSSEHPGIIRAGVVADLLLFRQRGWSELLSRPQWDRILLRNGKAVQANVPDYRELDACLP